MVLCRECLEMLNAQIVLIRVRGRMFSEMFFSLFCVCECFYVCTFYTKSSYCIVYCCTFNYFLKKANIFLSRPN